MSIFIIYPITCYKIYYTYFTIKIMYYIKIIYILYIIYLEDQDNITIIGQIRRTSMYRCPLIVMLLLYTIICMFIDVR